MAVDQVFRYRETLEGERSRILVAVLGNGQTGTMGFNTISSNTGAMYFFNSANVEVFLKVLNNEARPARK